MDLYYHFFIFSYFHPIIKVWNPNQRWLNLTNTLSDQCVNLDSYKLFIFIELSDQKRVELMESHFWVERFPACLPNILTWNSSTRCCHFFLEYIRIIYYLDVLLASFDSSFAHRNEIVFYSKIVLLLTIRKCIDTSSVNDCYSVYRWYFWNVFALIRTGLHRFS